MLQAKCNSSGPEQSQQAQENSAYIPHHAIKTQCAIFRLYDKLTVVDTRLMPNVICHLLRCAPTTPCVTQ